MANQNLVRIASRPGGLAESIIGDDLKHGQILETNYRRDGRMRPEVAHELAKPDTQKWWVPGSLSAGRVGGRFRLPMSVTVIHLAVYLDTAPTADFVVSITGQSPVRGGFPIADVTVPANSNYGETSIPSQTVPAGTFVGVTVGTPSGAAGLSVTLAILGDA